MKPKSKKLPFDGQTAQVHPYQFTTSMMDLAKDRGVKLVIGKATSIKTSSSKGPTSSQVTAVTYTTAEGKGELHTIEATHVIVAAGPWTSGLLPKLPIHGSRAHSIVIRPSAPVSAHVVFSEISSSRSRRVASPEIYPRPNGEVYVCGETDSLSLPESTALVKVDNAKCDAIFEQVAAISNQLRDGQVTIRQACYLPIGGPIIGELPDVKGLIVAAGHTCWGICNAPGTGKALSELIMDGKISCAYLGELEPRRFQLGIN